MKLVMKLNGSGSEHGIWNTKTKQKNGKVMSNPIPGSRTLNTEVWTGWGM